MSRSSMRALTVVLLALVCVACVRAATLTILFTGSLRGAVLPVDANGIECTPVQVEASTPTCVGGAARRTAFVRATAAAAANSLILDGGSNFWGSFQFQDSGSPYYMADLMAPIGYDAIAISKADLYAGTGPCAQFIRRTNLQTGSGAPPAFLATNMDVSKDADLSGLLLPYKIVTVNGTLKVGIFAIIDPAAAEETSHGPNVFFNTAAGNVNTTLSTEQIIDATVRTLRAQLACGMIIMITNLQVDQIETQSQLSIGIDLVLTSVYSRSDTAGAAVAYPLTVQTLLATSFVVAGIRDVRGGAVAVASVEFNGAVINATSISAVLVPLTNATQSPATGDLVTWGTVKALWASIQVAQQKTIAFTNISIFGLRGTNISTGGCRFTDCPAGRLATDAVLAWCTSCDIALINAGCIGASFNAGAITAADVASVLKFNDMMSTFDVKGITLVAALRNMAARGTNVASFLQVSGMRFAWNPDRSVAPKDAILEVEIFDKARQDFVSIDLARLYRVATTTFFRGGGDGYTMFADPLQVFNAVDSGPNHQTLMNAYLAPFSSPSKAVPAKSVDGLRVCYTTAAVPLRLGAGPCRTVATTGANNLLLQCASDVNLCNSLASMPVGIEGVVVNASMCARCTGLGTCADRVCTCAQPADGLFAGMAMVTGVACQKVRSVKDVPLAYANLLLALACIGSVLSVVIGVALFILRKHSAIAPTSPSFGVVTSIGTLGASVAIACLSQRQTDAMCQSWLWLSSIGFCLTFAALFVRTYRIHSIFNSDEGAVLISDWLLVRIVVAVLACDVALLTWWQLDSPYRAVGALLADDMLGATVECSSAETDVIGALLFVLKVCLLVWGVYLAHSVRHVEGNWNESRSIVLTIYNAAAALAIVIPILFFLRSSNVALVVLLKGVLAFYICCFTLLGLYGPRFFLIARGDSFKTADMFLKRAATTASTNKGAASLEDERAALVSSRAQLRAEIAILRHRLTELGVSDAEQPVVSSTASLALAHAPDANDPIAAFVHHQGDVDSILFAAALPLSTSSSPPNAPSRARPTAPAASAGTVEPDAIETYLAENQ